MKKFFAIMMFVFAGVAMNAQANMKFDTDVVDYGTIIQNADGVRTFKVTNTGNEDLIIKDIKSTCGCTVPQKPKGPIVPGATAEIKVKYDTKRLGPIRKTITVYANTENSPYPLKIKGMINKE